MIFGKYFLCFNLLLFSFAGQVLAAPSSWVQGTGLESMSARAFNEWVRSLEVADESFGEVAIYEPADGVVIPADAASPFIRWQSDASSWVIRLTAADQSTIQVLSARPYWEPDAKVWNDLMSRSKGRHLTIEVLPVGGVFGRTIGRGVSTQVHVDEHRLETPIAYLQMPLPFRKAQQRPEDAMWRKTKVSSIDEPEIFLTNLPLCANCHTYSSDGSTVAFDIDIDADKGSFMHMATAKSIEMTRADHGSWNQLSVDTPAPFSFGLFAGLSSTGRYLVGTVGETSLFVMIDRHDFSQLFYPVTGQIAVHDRLTRTISLVSGTDDPSYVHTSPRLSPDDQTLVFSRARVNDDYVAAVLNGQVRQESSNQPIEQLNERYPFRFNLYTLPFPSYDGVVPHPLTGASDNGMSNFFPRFSPDGRWIVFTRSPTGLVGQPGSELWVIPATGGEARKLMANTSVMNSWHSFSPDGRWLLFSGKGERAETQTFLTRFYEDGSSSKALRLHRLSRPEFANITPEFLPGMAAQMEQIHFLIEQNNQQVFESNVR